MNKSFAVLLVILVLGLGAFLFIKNQGSGPSPSQTQTEPPTKPVNDQVQPPKKSAHFESNTPEHGASLAGVPVNVVINFNFDLAPGSQIQIIKDGVGGLDYGLGETIIDKNKLSMRRKMDPASPDQMYTVFYKACWADGSCHDGNFQFKIDRSHVLEFTDLTGKKEVTLDIQNFSFNPAKIKVSKGTKVTWVNKDSVVHTVNTDSHPAHTYYLGQNSQDLAKAAQYSVTFADSGIYLYHCTPHADTMHGQILVE